MARANAGPTPAVLPLPPKLKEIVDLFESVPEFFGSDVKYSQILHYASKLPPLPPQYRTDRYRIRACTSRVWIRAYADPTDPSKVRFDADSDSALVRGLAAILVLGLSGESPAVIAGVPPDFQIRSAAGKPLVSDQRSDGFGNMLRAMKQQALRIVEGSGPDGPQDEILTPETADSGGLGDGFGRNWEGNDVVRGSNRGV